MIIVNSFILFIPHFFLSRGAFTLQQCVIRYLIQIFDIEATFYSLFLAVFYMFYLL